MSIATFAKTPVIIQRKSQTKDAMGSLVNTWSTHLTLKASIQPLSGDEARRYSRDQQQVNGKAYFVGVPDITNRDRLKFRGKIASIVNVRVPDELDRYTIIEYAHQEGVLT